MKNTVLSFALVLLAANPVLSDIPVIFGRDNDDNIEIEKISNIVNPIEQIIIAATFKNCSLVKRIFGIEYERPSSDNQPDTSKLTLDLWTKDYNKERFNILQATPNIVNSANFNRSLPIVIFFHGFMSTSESTAVLEVCSALTDLGKVNVMALDSGSLIMFFYYHASTYVHYIGNELGKILRDLVQEGTKAEDIHLIGHSLGAHIAGFAGKAFKNITGRKIGRITGLDPAGPCFFLEGHDSRLNRDDADFVDVIHTDGGVFGLTVPLGHIDFYPNNGQSQIGCPISTCSHDRSWQLYVESIRYPTAFPAVRCKDWLHFRIGVCSRNTLAYMGYGVDYRMTGTYYLTTAGSYPYGLGDRGYKGDHFL